MLDTVSICVCVCDDFLCGRMRITILFVQLIVVYIFYVNVCDASYNQFSSSPSSAAHTFKPRTYKLFLCIHTSMQHIRVCNIYEYATHIGIINKRSSGQRKPSCEALAMFFTSGGHVRMRAHVYFWINCI